MKCWSRSTLGVVIGVLNILAYIGCIAYLIYIRIDLASEGRRYEIERIQTIIIVVIVLCVVFAIISGLFIMGIVKRRHKLMIPWLIISAIGFVFNCGRFIYLFIASIMFGAPLIAYVIILISAVVGIGISAIILWPIYTLYRDIRKRNIEGSRSLPFGDDVTYKTPYN